MLLYDFTALYHDFMTDYFNDAVFMFKNRIKDISQYNDIDDCMKIWQYILIYLIRVTVILPLISHNLEFTIRLGNVFNKTSLRSL